MTWLPESIRLFTICDAMNWCHLPEPGGLYDQDPKLLDEWLVLFEQREKKRAKEQAEQDRKHNKGASPNYAIRNE